MTTNIITVFILQPTKIRPVFNIFAFSVIKKVSLLHVVEKFFMCSTQRRMDPI